MYEFFIENMEVYEINRFLILFGILRLNAGTYVQADSISLDLSNVTCKEALDAIKNRLIWIFLQQSGN